MHAIDRKVASTPSWVWAICVPESVQAFPELFTSRMPLTGKAAYRIVQKIRFVQINFGSSRFRVAKIKIMSQLPSGMLPKKCIEFPNSTCLSYKKKEKGRKAPRQVSLSRVTLPLPALKHACTDWNCTPWYECHTGNWILWSWDTFLGGLDWDLLSNNHSFWWIRSEDLHPDIQPVFVSPYCLSYSK